MASIEHHEVEIGRQLRALRIAEGLEQTALAERANTSVRTIQNLEAGRGSSLKTLIRVVRALDREDWLASLDPVGDGPSPMELLQAQRGQAARQRVRRR